MQYRQAIEYAANYFVENIGGARNPAIPKLLDMVRNRLPVRYKRKYIISDLRSAINAFERGDEWLGGYNRKPSPQN